MGIKREYSPSHFKSSFSVSDLRFPFGELFQRDDEGKEDLKVRKTRVIHV
jgi:hypothetical protein